ncbi:hypothetical protein BEI60_07590 [Eisenbergiella tayi]|nr:hypothetical protein BEI60_07590 [Eisenbergiella tayi]
MAPPLFVKIIIINFLFPGKDCVMKCLFNGAEIFVMWSSDLCYHICRSNNTRGEKRKSPCLRKNAGREIFGTAAKK